MSRVIQTVLIKTSLSIQLAVYVPYGYNAHKFSIKLMLQGFMDVNPSKKQKPTNCFHYIPDRQASEYRHELILHSKYNHVFNKK